MGGMSFLAFRSQKSSPSRRVAHIAQDLPTGFKRNSNPGADFRASLQNAKQYDYEELKAATGNFDAKNKIGEGAFGEVFKGTLNDGTLVAIKRLSARPEQDLSPFLREVEALSTQADHVNLVKLYGCCAEGQHRILVYGYLSKNSLAQTLLGDPCNKPEFTWKIRSRICVGLAEGMAFLHDIANPSIVHRDIKPSNVLLDEDYTPKIADFGIARIFPKYMTHITTHSRAGTFGYRAPEYILFGKLSPKVDVYSCGILFLEIVSGSRLTAEEQYLPIKAWKLYKKGKLDELVDKTLKGDSCIDEACRYLKIGLLCTQEVSANRPAMSNVVKMLKGEIDVDKRKIPKPRKLMALLALPSSSWKPRAPWIWSCFCGS